MDATDIANYDHEVVISKLKGNPMEVIEAEAVARLARGHAPSEVFAEVHERQQLLIMTLDDFEPYQYPKLDEFMDREFPIDDDISEEDLAIMDSHRVEPLSTHEEAEDGLKKLEVMRRLKGTDEYIESIIRLSTGHAEKKDNK